MIIYGVRTLKYLQKRVFVGHRGAFEKAKEQIRNSFIMMALLSEAVHQSLVKSVRQESELNEKHHQLDQIQAHLTRSYSVSQQDEGWHSI